MKTTLLIFLVIATVGIAQVTPFIGGGLSIPVADTDYDTGYSLSLGLEKDYDKYSIGANYTRLSNTYSPTDDNIAFNNFLLNLSMVTGEKIDFRLGANVGIQYSRIAGIDQRLVTWGPTASIRLTNSEYLSSYLRLNIHTIDLYDENNTFVTLSLFFRLN